MISLELVPRYENDCLQEGLQAFAEFEQINAINIPDVLRVPIRSWEMVSSFLSKQVNGIPHLRSIDRTAEDTVRILAPLVAEGMSKVLIVSGDIPADPQFVSSEQTPLDYVGPIKKAFPDLKVYAALDPYRSSISAEVSYCLQKIEAGFDGFFTQPFFETELLSIYLNRLQGTEVFAGISPVTSQRSIGYWEKVNKVSFPKGFQTNLQYQAELGRDLLKVSESYNQHSYLMPITLSAVEYLRAVFN